MSMQASFCKIGFLSGSLVDAWAHILSVIEQLAQGLQIPPFMTSFSAVCCHWQCVCSDSKDIFTHGCSLDETSLLFSVQ